MNTELIFKKTGQEIKEAIGNRLKALNLRLEKRNVELDKFLADSLKVRSYVLRNTQYNSGHGGRYFSGGNLYAANHISSEEVEETNQLCTRVMEIEQEIEKLKLTVKHLKDDQEFDLKLQELINFGFN